MIASEVFLCLQKYFLPEDPMYRFVIFTTLVAAVSTAGCGSGVERPPLVPTSGVVTMGGKPVENVSVTFHPESGRSANGVTDAEGKFRLTTFDTNDGAQVGKHKVSLTMIVADIPDEIPDDYDYAADAAPPEAAIPASYADPNTSGLVSTIVGDETLKEVTLEVEAGK